MPTEIAVIQDKVNVRSQAAAEAAEPGSIAIENVAGVMKLVDDQGVATTIATGSSSGTVTSVAATASGLLAVAGTPTVAPTVGMAAAAAHTTIGNPTAGSAVPKAMSQTELTAELNAATLSLPGAMSAADFSKLNVAYARPVLGANLADADATVNPGKTIGMYVCPAGTLSVTRTITLGITGTPVQTQILIIRMLDVGGQSLIIKNNSASTLVTTTGGIAADYWFYFNAGTFIANIIIPIQTT